MSEQMKGNPYTDESFMNEAKATLALTHELRTANLIAAYQVENLVVHDAERQEIEREILERLGVRDA